MATKLDMPAVAFGPVPSRRLGRSLGINNIPPKVCSYSCVYCQVGPTLDRTIEPRDFYPPERIVAEVSGLVEQSQGRGEWIDYLTFVPDGEPTLDAGLGESIGMLRSLEIKIAVITNGSLLWRPEVCSALSLADWVSVKVDAATESVWRRVDRPHSDLDLAAIEDGLRTFAAGFDGYLVSETMLVKGYNDGVESVEAVGELLHEVAIRTAYLSIPTRPTPYPDITAPDKEAVVQAYAIVSRHVPHVEYLVGYEGDAFAASGVSRDDLLAITAVHPMRESAVVELLDRSGEDWSVVESLLEEGLLTQATHNGQIFYVRRWR